MTACGRQHLSLHLSLRLSVSHPSVFLSAVNRCRVQHCNHNPPGHFGSLSLMKSIFFPPFSPPFTSPLILSLSPSSARPQRTGCGSVVITELNDLACSAIDGFVAALVFCPIWGNFLEYNMLLRGPLCSIQSEYESITCLGQIMKHQTQNLRVLSYTLLHDCLLIKDVVSD